MAEKIDLIIAWQLAADDLGIEVVSPYIVDGVAFPVLVVSFGRAAGALPLFMGDPRCCRAAMAQGFFVSHLNPSVYSEYDRGRFIETLMDWGWFGLPENAPAWYAEETAKTKA